MSVKSNKAKFFLDFGFKAAVGGETERNGVPGIYIEGEASTFVQDRDGEFVDKQAFADGNDAYFKLNPVLLYGHGMDPQIAKKPLGEIIQHKMTKTGLWVKAWVPRPEETFAPMMQVYKSMVNGILKTFSIGGIFERVKNVITKVELFEISVEPVQSNPTALFAVMAKAFDPDNVINGKNELNIRSVEEHGISEAIAQGRFHSERWRITDILGMALHKLYNDSEMKPREQAAKAEEILAEFGVAIIKLFKNQKTATEIMSIQEKPEDIAAALKEALDAEIMALGQKWGVISGDGTASIEDAKAGRVLSKANEAALEKAIGTLNDILAKLKKGPVTTEVIKD